MCIRDSCGSEAFADKKVALRFCAMGDVPYKLDEWDLLEKQVRELPPNLDFIIHLGDIKRGLLPCFEPNYKQVADILAKSKAPAFIVIGDNEWNDCPRPAVGFQYWNRHLLRLDERWKHKLKVTHDAKHDENFAFTKNKVLVIGLNLVGGAINDKKEWKQRHSDNIDWIKQSIKTAKANGKVNRMVILALSLIHI